jgi:Peptidase_C39 like family/NPCBM-associated, NEW3 domain of alpha-galactosidase
MRLILLCLLSLTAVASEPSAYRIPMATPIVQPNAFACGPASAKMLLDYAASAGPNVAIEDVMAVVRLTSNGTAVGDMIRGGHFSGMSSAPGRTGSVAPFGGYPQRALGMAVLTHAQATSWLPQVKALIRQDIPVLFLMGFTVASPGGHFRVAMGYDDATQTMWFADPWGRELKGEQDALGFQPFSYADVEQLWTYTGYGTTTPHWGAIFVPWSVALSTTRSKSTLSVRAVTTYPCPAPFSTTQFPASQANATLSVPVGWRISGASSQSLGTVNAGVSRTTTWSVTPGAYPARLRVESQGMISGSPPATGPYDGTAGNGQIFPAYQYQDVIGGSAVIDLGTGG